MQNPKQILEYYKNLGLPANQHTGLLVVIDKEDFNNADNSIIVPKDKDTISSRNPDLVTGVILNTPINCSYDELSEGKRILFNPIDGARLKINGHMFHILDESFVLAILND